MGFSGGNIHLLCQNVKNLFSPKNLLMMFAYLSLVFWNLFLKKLCDTSSRKVIFQKVASALYIIQQIFQSVTTLKKSSKWQNICIKEKKRSLFTKLIDILIIQKSKIFGFEKEDFQQNKNLFSYLSKTILTLGNQSYFFNLF